MPLPRAITGGAPLELGGRRWWLRITYGVLLACEEESGVDMLAAGVDVAQAPARLLRALLWASLSMAGATWSTREVGQMLTLRILADARRAVIEAWVASMAERGSGDAGGSSARVLTPLEAWAAARYELGLSDAEWLDMTPRQLHALQRVRLEQMQREELLVGILASTTANFGARAPARAMRAEGFMLHPFEHQEAQGPVTGEMIMAALAPIKQDLAKE